MCSTASLCFCLCVQRPTMVALGASSEIPKVGDTWFWFWCCPPSSVSAVAGDGLVPVLLHQSAPDCRLKWKIIGGQLKTNDRWLHRSLLPRAQFCCPSRTSLSTVRSLRCTYWWITDKYTSTYRSGPHSELELPWLSFKAGFWTGFGSLDCKYTKSLSQPPPMPPLAGQGPVGTDRTGCQVPWAEQRAEGEPPRNLEDRMGEFHQNTHCFLDFSKYFFWKDLHWEM